MTEDIPDNLKDQSLVEIAVKFLNSQEGRQNDPNFVLGTLSLMSLLGILDRFEAKGTGTKNEPAKSETAKPAASVPATVPTLQSEDKKPSSNQVLTETLMNLLSQKGGGKLNPGFLMSLMSMLNNAGSSEGSDSGSSEAKAEEKPAATESPTALSEEKQEEPEDSQYYQLSMGKSQEKKNRPW